ncbi:P-loop containing nucleoside triphosphate hydrolase protein [Biscogniauxia mediterranea]|nr:P-loop containing nucleoside triphosphate hydrolase protein [Biscogniauxia mediterranea]
MVASFNTESLNGLCSDDQLKLLDSVDRLRLQGIDHYISLPQIIVCGDQSSGKSSVLEAISGVPFPVKSNTCTRFPTEVVLRRAKQTNVTVSIVPHKSLGLSEKNRLSGFHEKLDGFEDLPALIESAKVAMGISMEGTNFSKDLLRVEITGPDRPHLTIVDLPGVIHSQTKQQTAEDVKLVREVVESYMKQPRTIILAVFSAKNDLANQAVLSLARSADPYFARTMGVITKPDVLYPGSDNEAFWISVVENKEVEFRHEWHVLKNLDSEKESRPSLLHNRNVDETRFFSEGNWKDVSPSLKGIDTLRRKLSDILLRQIASELPSLISEIDAGLEYCKGKLAELGEPRKTFQEQRRQLMMISQRFQGLVKSALDGTYTDPFFGSAESEKGYHKRLRAVIQNLNRELADELIQHGHKRVVITEAESKSTDSKSETKSEGQISITRDAFIDYIQNLMRRSRGRELPGRFNSMIVSDLFVEQSHPWEPIVRRHAEKVWKAAAEFLNLVITYVADETTAGALLKKVFKPALRGIFSTMDTKTTELLKSQRCLHPVTYNRQYSETVQAISDKRRKEFYSNILRSTFGSIGPSVQINTSRLNVDHLVEQLSRRTEPDIERFAASEALDCMDAYYDVAIKRFIDDVAVEIIENKLVSALSDILSPIVVDEMSPSLVSSIAGESQESRKKREDLVKQLEVLKYGSETCKRFVDVRLGGESDMSDADSLFDKIESHDSQHQGLENELRNMEVAMSDDDEMVLPSVPALGFPKLLTKKEKRNLEKKQKVTSNI